MNLFTAENLVLLTYAHFLIFFVPAAAIGVSVWRTERRRLENERKGGTIEHVTLSSAEKRAA